LSKKSAWSSTEVNMRHLFLNRNHNLLLYTNFSYKTETALSTYKIKFFRF
jgi:hypothetical protein